MNVYKVLEATLEEYKLLRHWDSLTRVENIPGDIKLHIDLEVSNHEYVWQMVEHLLLHIDKEDLLHKSKDVLDTDAYTDFSRTVQAIADMV